MGWLMLDFMDPDNFDFVLLQDQVSPLSQTFSAVNFNTKLLDEYTWKEVTGKGHVPGLGPQLMGKRVELGEDIVGRWNQKCNLPELDRIIAFPQNLRQRHSADFISVSMTQ